ncbi:hypothetical protein GCM10022267_38760 [Lentzea roselyniae]|uniref:Uncharacterized protein n=1 Tax=Lentzea roselyniae TaxID=531940 RepID=A0ABP7B3W5_9PSEU
MDFERELADHRYYAVFKGDSKALGQAAMLVRRPAGHREEEYVGHNTWVHTDKLYRLKSGRDWTDDHLEISEAEAVRLKHSIDASVAARWRHHVISADGTPFAVVLTAKNPESRARPQQISRYAYRGLEETDLLDRLPGEPTWRAEDTEPVVATEIMARIEQRWRDEAGLTGGYAVFREQTDVLDLDSACAVVPEPASDHEFAVRLHDHEAAQLTALIHLRNAKRRAEPVGDHLYFALFHNVEDAVDVRNAYSVIRSTVRSWPQKWETFLRPGEWLPTARPASERTLLPLGEADLTVVTDRLAAGHHRYLEVRCRGRGPVALLRLTGTTEESASDQGWEPSDVLTRLPGEQSWFVSELDEKTARHRFRPR